MQSTSWKTTTGTCWTAQNRFYFTFLRNVTTALYCGAHSQEFGSTTKVIWVGSTRFKRCFSWFRLYVRGQSVIMLSLKPLGCVLTVCSSCPQEGLVSFTLSGCWLSASSSIIWPVACAKPFLANKPTGAGCAKGVFGSQTWTNGTGSGEKSEFGIYYHVLPQSWWSWTVQAWWTGLDQCLEGGPVFLRSRGRTGQKWSGLHHYIIGPCVKY